MIIDEKKIIEAFAGIKKDMGQIKEQVNKNAKTHLHTWAILERTEGTQSKWFGTQDIIKYLYSCSECGATRQETFIVPPKSLSFNAIEELQKKMDLQNEKMDKILEMAAFEEELK